MDMKIYLDSEMLWKISYSAFAIHPVFWSPAYFKQVLVKILIQVINKYVEQFQAKGGCQSIRLL